MKWRARLAFLQVAVFVGGGLLAPALHITWHRPDHSHGWAAAVDVHSSEGSAAPRPAKAHGSRGLAPTETARHSHSHPHSHPHPHPGHGTTPAAEEQSAPPAPQTQPIERTHGHGSLAHLGLALLSGPPPMALPTPRLLGLVPRRAHPRVVSLFRPGFPRPRPPPTAVCS